jgi:hypothetical protein
MTPFAVHLVADGAVVVWTSTAALTFLLIGLPVLFLLYVMLKDDDKGFDRRVREIERHVELRRHEVEALPVRSSEQHSRAA